MLNCLKAQLMLTLCISDTVQIKLRFQEMLKLLYMYSFVIVS